MAFNRRFTFAAEPDLCLAIDQASARANLSVSEWIRRVVGAAAMDAAAKDQPPRKKGRMSPMETLAYVLASEEYRQSESTRVVPTIESARNALMIAIEKVKA
jgi:hypothetical protein